VLSWLVSDAVRAAGENCVRN